MKLFNSVVVVTLIAGVSPGFAQNATPTVIDCDDPANAEEEVCLALPPQDATNFAPLVGAAAGLLGLGALAGGGGSTSTTTTSTTGTN